MSRSSPLPEPPEHIEVPVGSFAWAITMVGHGWMARRKSWPGAWPPINADDPGLYNLDEDDVFAEDWLLVE